jgi:hypothetical protein
MLAFIPLIGKFLADNWRAAAVLILTTALFFAGWHYGARHVQTQWDAAKLAQAKAVAKVEVKQAAVTEKVVTQYVDRVQVIHEQGKTLTKQVVKYVPLSTPDLPYGFRLLHDAAATGVPLPETPGRLDGPTVPAAQVAGTIVDNYTGCRANGEQVKALQDWINGEAGASK